jgi:hypothetical protein
MGLEESKKCHYERPDGKWVKKGSFISTFILLEMTKKKIEQILNQFKFSNF